MRPFRLVPGILIFALAAYPQPPHGIPAGGPYRHKVLSASSKDGLLWTRDAGVRLDHASVPCAIADGERILLYYVDADRGPGQTESVGCAISRDGMHFEKQPFAIEGMAARKALDPSAVRDPDGKLRLYYLASDAHGDPAAEPRDHQIHMALSDDGIRFRSAGPAFTYPALVDPDVFFFKNSWFMYVFGGRGTLIATSTDGRRFEYKQALDLPGWGAVAPLRLDDGRLRLYAFEQRKPRGNAVRSFLSTNGVDWTAEPGDRLVAADTEQITDPFVIRWRDGYKMYFKVDQPAERNPRPADGQPATQRRPGPWDQDLLVHRISPDGRVERIGTFPRAGVPTVTRMNDGRLIAANQHFPENDPAAFDKVAVRFSSDEGRTWTTPQVIQLAGLPEGMRFPFDPTLVPLPDGRLRLYFTSRLDRRSEEDKPAIHSAISQDGIHYTFEPGVRFGIAGRPVIDCAVALHHGVFHLYSPDNETEPGTGYHATSKDGLNFVRAADVRMEGGRRWLGNVLSEGDSMTFAGTGAGAVWFASSPDGASWKLLDTARVPGADPGAVRTKDGGWIVISTGPPRPGTPGAAPIAQNADGPRNHRILLATSKDGLEWKVADSALAEHASVPDLFAGPEGRPILLFVDASGSTQPGALGAMERQSDGLWTRRVTNLHGADPNVVRLKDNTYRAYTKERDGGIQVFASVNGLDWRQLGEAFRDERYRNATDPDVFQTPSGWVMLISLGPRLLRCTSRDGLKFTAGETLDLGGSVSDTVEAAGGWRTYFHVNAGPRTAGKMVIRSAFTADGQSWHVEDGDRVRAPESGPAGLGVADPAPLKLADGTWLMALKSFIAPPRQPKQPAPAGR